MPRWLRVALTVGLAWVLSWSGSEPVRFPAPPPAPGTPPALGVAIERPAVPAGPWGAEAVGLVLALTERAVGELPGLVPFVVGAPASPGLAHAPVGGRATLTLTLALDGDTLTIDATTCPPSAACDTTRETASRLAPQAAVVRLARHLGARLGRPASAGLDRLALPETADPYAALLLGRAGAVSFGFLPPPEVVGDPQRDPIARAVFLDPAMVTGQALLARAPALPPARRLDAAQLALQGDGASVVRLADLAAVLDELGQPARAHERWVQVGERAPDDPRFLVPRARAELRAGEVGAARALVAALPAAVADDPRVLALQVELADHDGRADDALLARWADAAPADPAPVRARVALAVAEARREDALALADELTRRGATAEADRLRLALASELGRWTEAARAAGALGAPDVARLLAAAGAETDPTARLTLLAGLDTPPARHARADALVDHGRVPDALAELDAVLDSTPYLPEALDRLARTRALAGDRAGAARARARLAWADPLYPGATP